MIILLVAGASALFVSTQLNRIWWIFVWFLIGMTCLSLLLLQISDALALRLRKGTYGWWPAAFGGMAAFGFVVVAVTIARQWSPVLAIGGMVVLTLGIVGVHLWFEDADRRGRDRADAADEPDAGDEPDKSGIAVGSTIWYGFEAMAVGVGLFLISDGIASLVGSVAWLIGLVILKTGAMSWLGSSGDDLEPRVRILIDAALVGVVVLFAGAFGSSTVLVLIGVTVVTAALSMVGVGALYLDCPRSKSYWAMGLALVAMGGLWAWMAVVTQNPGLALVFGLLFALAGGFFVLRGEGIVLLMLAAYVIAWGLVDRSVPPPAESDDPVRIVALGDSYISGEGATEFFEGTNDVGGNQCRRAPSAYPQLVAAALDTTVVSLACSGARLADLATCGQMWPGGRRCLVAQQDEQPDDVSSTSLRNGWGDPPADDADAPPGRRPQLVTAMDLGLTDAAEVVLLSIGGNDVGFSAIVKACLLPSGCDERRDLWLESIDLLATQLDETYAEIARTFPNAKVMVMPYPKIVNPEPDTSCELGLSQDERVFVVDFISRLDLTISAAAERAGFVFVEEAVDAYVGSQLCDDEAAANHLRLVPPDGHQLGRYSPATWIPGSMHPNRRGHLLTAGAAVCSVASQLGLGVADFPDWLPVVRPGGCTEADLAGRSEPVAAEVPGGGGVAEEARLACEAATATGGATSIEQAVACAAAADVVEARLDEVTAGIAVVTDELVSDDEWIRVELFRTVRALALPLLLLLAAGMVFAWGFAQLSNPLSRFLRQEQNGDGP